MMCFSFRSKKPKEKPSFIRRMATFGRGSPDRPRLALLGAVFIGTAPGGDFRSMVGDGLDGPLKKACHESVKRHIQGVYDDLRGKNRKLSRDKLVTFFKETQGMVALEPLEFEDYTFQEFLYVWIHCEDAWHAARKLRVDENDTSKPISNYFISSSHNTYLEGNQLSSRSSAEAYTAVLRSGCRCIEIDVWNSPSSRTPSKSPNPGQAPEHRRHLSSPSLSRLTPDALRQAVSNRLGRHCRAASTGQSLCPEARDSGTSLDPKELSIRPSRSRDSSTSNFRGEPVVHHRGTMTTTVGFREVCRAIRESAFKTNHLPVIVSLEVGADREQQLSMVQIMKEEWDGLLLDQPFEGCDPNERQPRLNELFNKILIKVKRLSDDCLTETEVERGRTLQLDGIPGRAKPPICEELAALAIYTHSEHFENHESLALRSPSHIFSLSEHSFSALAGDGERSRKMHEHNRDFFMRIYPKGLRFTSSNPDPSFHWRRGVQMVAMNWQRTDEGMMLNDAMFADTAGWILKPPGFLSGSDAVDIDAIPKKTLDLRVTIFAGQFLPLPETRRQSGVGVAGDKKFRPFVKVELHVEKHHRSLDYTRETPPCETDNPDWGLGAAPLEFLDVKNVVEELSFLRFKVEDRSSGFLEPLVAWACIRLDRLQQGYRCIDLLDPHTRQPSSGQLFVKIEKKAR